MSSSSGIENPMNPELYTERAWNAIAKAPPFCDKYKTQYVETTLLMKSMLDDGPSGLAQRILVKAGIDVAKFDSKLEDHLQKQPKVSDVANKMMGKTMGPMLTYANVLKKEYGDSFVSIEHLILAMADDGYVKTLFKEFGVTKVKLKEAVKEIRGNNKVSSKVKSFM